MFSRKFILNVVFVMAVLCIAFVEAKERQVKGFRGLQDVEVDKKENKNEEDGDFDLIAWFLSLGELLPLVLPIFLKFLGLEVEDTAPEEEVTEGS